MSEITATVKRLDGDFVWVETDPASACSRCKGGGGCTSISISRLFCSPKQHFKVINHMPLSIGDVVSIALPDEVMIKTAIWSYGIPIAALLIGAIVGQWIWPAKPDVGSIVCGAISFVSGLLSLRLLESARGKEEIYPTVLMRISGPVVVMQSR